jgi:membrane-bound lytic murein transglycosylase D
MERFKILRICMALLIVLGLYFELYADHLPYRQELSPDISFWKKIFTEVSSNQYIIHDSQHLSVIYTTVTFDSKVSERKRQRDLKVIKKKYEALLWRFHYNDKDTVNLQSWEKRIFDKFKSINEPGKFKHAARRVRAQQGIREKFVEGLERSFAYLPTMEKIFSRFNLPRELVYMPHIESSFAINAASRVGAKGMWQFMWSTARYFLKMNRSVDQRFDPVYSTEAAAKLLKRNYRELNDWALAITAYNHGLAGMKRAKRKFDGDYLRIREGYLKRSFGFASKNFYPEFLAVVEIMDSLDYYFPNVGRHPLFCFNEIKLTKSLNIPRFARESKLDLNELKWLNPSFKRGVWRGTSLLYSGYTLRIPENVDIDKALTLLGFDDAIALSPARGNNPEANKTTDHSIQVSFSKPVVEPGNNEFLVAPSFLASFEQAKKEIEPVTFAAIYKPGVEINADVAVQEAQLDEWFQGSSNRNEAHENLFAASFSKPDVNPGEIAMAGFQFFPDDDKIAPDPRVRSVVGEEPISKSVSENISRNGPIAKASYSVSLNDIKQILRQRLQVRDGKIVIFPHETIGHIAEWSGLSAGYIRSLNNLHYGQKIFSGQKLRINFSHISPEQLTAQRLAYHLDLIRGMLNGKTELQLVEYKVNPGENLWNISRRRFDFPVNLLLYFNDLNKLERLYPGDIIKLPVI